MAARAEFEAAEVARAEAESQEAARIEAERQEAERAEQQRQREAAQTARKPLQVRVEAPVIPQPEPPVAEGDIWWQLALCECGGNPGCNTGNGYYGTFQFLLSTWQSVGGTGYPHEHSYAEQKERAQILQARSGWGQWPACSRKLGLL